MSLGQTAKAPMDGVRDQASEAVAEARPWVERLSRLGLIAKGLVYCVIGALALQVAIGAGGKTTDASGALVTMLSQPNGRWLLGTVAVGLFGHAVWRLIQVFFDPERRRTGAKGMLKRAGYLLSGGAYMALTFTAVRMLWGGGGGKTSSQEWAGRFFSQPSGQWLVGLVGVLAICVGINVFAGAVKGKFKEKFRLTEMSETEERWVMLSGRIGYAARGVVYGLIGYFLIQAALHLNPKEARGIEDVLAALAHQSNGPWLLGTVAVGLIAYGGHQIVAARYRRVWA